MTNDPMSAKNTEAPEELRPDPAVEPLTDSDLEAVSGGTQAFCSVVACSG